MPDGSSSDLVSLFQDEGAECEFYGPAIDSRPIFSIKGKIERRFKILKSEFALLRHLLKKDLRETVIHVDLPPQKSFLAVAALCLKAHVFFTLHNSFVRNGLFREFSWLLKLRIISLSRHFHFFAANQDAKEYLIQYLSKRSARRLRLVRDGINTSSVKSITTGDFDRIGLRARLGITTDKTVVLTAGQFVDRKGRWPYLETIAHLGKKRSDIACLWLAPQYPSESDLERVQSYNTNASFRLILSSQIGSSREEILRFFLIGDLFVLPSYIEGVPIALLEAMSLGLPCISTNVNGIPEAIHPEITGLLVEPGDSEALGNAIERIVDDPLLGERLGRQGQQFVLTNFDDRESARVALQEYETCFAAPDRKQSD